MKYFIFSDIHGNLAALDVVLAQIDAFAPDRIICLGDIVGYGPDPNECVQKVTQVADIIIMGNHDHAVLGLTDTSYFNQYAKKAVLWTRDALTDENFDLLESFPFQVSEEDALFVHATPAHPERWDYIFNPLEAKYYLQHQAEHVSFIGHSHQPLFFEADNEGRIAFERKPEFTLSLREGCKYIINVGSVGQPRDGDPRTSFVIYDNQAERIELHRLQYDFSQTQQKILDAGLPAFLADRIAQGR